MTGVERAGEPAGGGAAGFSLLEVLVAMVILGAALVGILRLAGQQGRGEDQAVERLQVAVQARGIMEQMLWTGMVEPGQHQGPDGRTWSVRAVVLPPPPVAEEDPQAGGIEQRMREERDGMSLGRRRGLAPVLVLLELCQGAPRQDGAYAYCLQTEYLSLVRP